MAPCLAASVKEGMGETIHELWQRIFDDCCDSLFDWLCGDAGHLEALELLAPRVPKAVEETCEKLSKRFVTIARLRCVEKRVWEKFAATSPQAPPSPSSNETNGREMMRLVQRANVAVASEVLISIRPKTAELAKSLLTSVSRAEERLHSIGAAITANLCEKMKETAEAVRVQMEEKNWFQEWKG